MRWILAWAVHGLTAAGAALALVAAIAAGAGAWQTVFGALGLALVVDAVDGPLARMVGARKQIPWFDGGVLDLVIDYATYAFVPALVVVNAKLLSAPFAIGAGIAVTVFGAFYLADTRMKTTDNAFRGFPAVWNAVVFLLLVYRPPEVATLAVIAALCGLTFAPVEFVHPIRVRRLRPVTLAVTLVWGVSAVLALAADFDPSPAVKIVLAVASLYLALVGAVMQAIRRLS